MPPGSYNTPKQSVPLTQEILKVHPPNDILTEH